MALSVLCGRCHSLVPVVMVGGGCQSRMALIT